MNMKFKIVLAFIIIASIVLYFLIRWLFVKNYLFPFGEGLEKKDWLSFLSGYLAFVGTIIITSIVIIQNNSYREMDNERLRLQNMPNLKFNKLDLFTKINYMTLKDLKEQTLNPAHKELLNKSKLLDTELVALIDNCPLIIWGNGDFKINGKENSQDIILQKDANSRAIYFAENYGIGSAINIEIRVKENLKGGGESFDYGGIHLKEGEKVYFEILYSSLASELNKDVIIEFSFIDVLGNKYCQKCIFNMKIANNKYDFSLKQKDREPIHIK